MAVGQFFNPEEGSQELSPWFMLQSSYSQKVVIFLECTDLYTLDCNLLLFTDMNLFLEFLFIAVPVVTSEIVLILKQFVVYRPYIAKAYFDAYM